jgi:hypothetical protein
MFSGCSTDGDAPRWIQAGAETGIFYEDQDEFGDFDAPAVLYSATPEFLDPTTGEKRSWVMYYSKCIDADEYSCACIGRATATGPVTDLVWTDDGTPVYCSNLEFTDDGAQTKYLFTYHYYDSQPTTALAWLPPHEPVPYQGAAKLGAQLLTFSDDGWPMLGSGTGAYPDWDVCDLMGCDPAEVTTECEGLDMFLLNRMHSTTYIPYTVTHV